MNLDLYNKMSLVYWYNLSLFLFHVWTKSKWSFKSCTLSKVTVKFCAHFGYPKLKKKWTGLFWLYGRAVTVWQYRAVRTELCGLFFSLWCCGSTIVYPLDRFYRFWLSVVAGHSSLSSQYQFSRILTTIVNFLFSYQYKNKVL